MATPKTARRYARAFFDRTRDQGRLDEVQADLAALQGLIDASADFRALLAHPGLPPERVNQAVGALFRGRLREETLQFIRFLVDKKRLDHLPDICERFIQLYNEHQGILHVRVTSAVPLDSAQEQAFAKKLGAKFKRTVQLGSDTDPSLIGGFRVRVGDTIHDYSIQTMLETFKQKMMNA